MVTCRIIADSRSTSWRRKWPWSETYKMHYRLHRWRPTARTVCSRRCAFGAISLCNCLSVQRSVSQRRAYWFNAKFIAKRLMGLALAISIRRNGRQRVWRELATHFNYAAQLFFLSILSCFKQFFESRRDLSSVFVDPVREWADRPNCIVKLIHFMIYSLHPITALITQLRFKRIFLMASHCHLDHSPNHKT